MARTKTTNPGRRTRGGRRPPGRAPQSERREADQSTTPIVNATARRDAIAEACENVYQLDKQIRAAIQRHVADLREDRGAILKNLREDYQITAPVFKARYAAYRLERQAAESQDENTLDVIRELFDAIPIGEVVQFVEDAASGAHAAPAAEAEAGEVEEMTSDDARAYESGLQAGRDGQGLQACPFKGAQQPNLRLRTKWESGWSDGQAQRAEALEREGAHGHA